ncbi:4Fe-4S single cluster domain-containing protein [Streptomyces sp. NPDC127098]|uniref:4Fe-4S single cluster domain-containing protein n=1 Tax=Streptomyces sp. NPDC127098 TaxID=3347137 RepID=UPI00364A661A
MVDETPDPPGEVGAAARISGTHFPVTTLGPGRRLGIWFQGCPLACPGCMSRHTWDPAGGRAVGLPQLLDEWRAALAAGADGLTVSGGEPLAQPVALARLLAGAAELRREAGAGGRRVDILVYTGLTEAELAPEPGLREALRHADALISGRYVAAEPTDLVWRGSANQRLRPLTELGRQRYGPHLARTAAGPRLQVAWPPAGGVLLYGVPGRGELSALERRLREAGIRLRGPSWRQ